MVLYGTYRQACSSTTWYLIGPMRRNKMWVGSNRDGIGSDLFGTQRKCYVHITIAHNSLRPVYSDTTQFDADVEK